MIGLAAGPAGLGHQVGVVRSAGGDLRAQLDGIGVPVVVLGRRAVRRRLSPLPTVRLWRQLRRMRPDVVHAHQVAGALAALVAGAALSVPVVVTEHTMATWHGRWARHWRRRLYRYAARCIAVSQPIGRERRYFRTLYDFR